MGPKIIIIASLCLHNLLICVCVNDRNFAQNFKPRISVLVIYCVAILCCIPSSWAEVGRLTFIRCLLGLSVTACLQAPLVKLQTLEGTARYAGFLLAPAEGFGFRPKPFFGPLGKKRAFNIYFGPHFGNFW